ESIALGFRTGTVKRTSLENVNVDTTVQEKAVSFPTDAKLYWQMLGKLVKQAGKYNVDLRQSYRRVSKTALMQANRYFHARQTKLALREVRRLKTMLGRVTRDIVRKISGKELLQEAFGELLKLSERLLNQKKDDKNKLYSLHAPEVECIAKGKAHKKYEFGNKAAFVSSSREGFIFGARGLHGNPYDGHTLADSLEQAKRLCGDKVFGRAFVDRGYRGHKYKGPTKVYICGPGTGQGLPRSLRRWRKRRSAIEPVIGHMKNDGRLGRNYLLGKEGDRVNVVLSAVGYNLRLILARLAKIPGGIFFLFACLVVFFRRISAAATLQPARTG
ncbi:MAG: IS5 family transposase, partial [Planctomycetes bacterium]|nr:IS5 family transposase [Planctomycetota bacterium]